MDTLAALRLQVEWGADEALDDQPRDHFRPATFTPPAFTSPVFTPPVFTPGAATPAAIPPPIAAARPRPASLAASATGMAQDQAAAAVTLDDLHAALAAFEGCPLRATATTTVRPDGNPAARVVLIAEAPGADDDRAGVAFAGPSGAALDRVLASAGLDRSILLLTPMVPWRPPGGRAPSEAEVHACLPFLLRLLQLVRPERLLLLGAGPVKALTGSTDGIRRLRGRWLEAAIPSPSGNAPLILPALAMLPWDQWLRSPSTKRDSWADLLALRQALLSTD